MMWCVSGGYPGRGSVRTQYSADAARGEAGGASVWRGVGARVRRRPATARAHVHRLPAGGFRWGRRVEGAQKNRSDLLTRHLEFLNFGTWCVHVSPLHFSSSDWAVCQWCGMGRTRRSASGHATGDIRRTPGRAREPAQTQSGRSRAGHYTAGKHTHTYTGTVNLLSAE